MRSSLIKSKIKKKKNCNIKSQPPSQVIVGRTWKFLDYSLVKYLYHVEKSINVKYLIVIIFYLCFFFTPLKESKSHAFFTQKILSLGE